MGGQIFSTVYWVVGQTYFTGHNVWNLSPQGWNMSEIAKTRITIQSQSCYNLFKSVRYQKYILHKMQSTIHQYLLH